MNVSLQAAIPVLEDMLAAGLRARLRVTGSSMRPFVLDGDVVELADAGRPGITATPCRPESAGSLGRSSNPRMPSRGDILLVRRASGDFVLHRVSRVTPTGFFLRGDAQCVEEGPLAPEQVVARAAGLVRDGRLIPLDRGIRRWLGRLWQATLPLHPLLIAPLRAAKRLLSLCVAIR